MLKTLIIHEGRYGTTKKTAEILSLILGPAKTCKTREFKENYKDFDFIIIGSAVYSGKFPPEIMNFIENNADWLKTKHVALFSISLSPEDGEENLLRIKELLGNISLKKALKGKLNLDKINKKDLESLNQFSEKYGFKLVDMDNFNLEEVVSYGLLLKSIRDDSIKKLPSEKLKSIVDEFLKNHNTCTLSTSFNGRVRATPIEYNYFDGHIYLLSEGGEKFANILLNKNVSLAVYEDYMSMNNLAGMQLSGKASLVEDPEEYQNIIKMKGLKPQFIKNLPINMNILKIEILKIEFLYSKFKEMGYDARQVIKF